jgi:hypothetical protein
MLPCPHLHTGLYTNATDFLVPTGTHTLFSGQARLWQSLTIHTDSSAAVQAIKWAQQSALQATTPTLTLIVLPANGASGIDGGYMRWVQQHSQHCKHLLCLPKSSLTWQPPANALHEKG